MKTCTIDGCTKPVHGRGFCDVHWYRWHKHGDPHITLYRPKGSGHKRKDGYIAIVVNGRHWLEHRYVWTCAHGPIPPRYQVHHRNGIKDDNRLENLELIHIQRHGHIHSIAKPPHRHSVATRAKLSAIAKARKGKRVTYCSVAGCDLPSHARHLCNKHYLRWKAHGTTEASSAMQRDPSTGRLLSTRLPANTP